MDAVEARTKIEELIVEVCADEDVLADPDLDLFQAGFLDSMAAIELLVGIEDVFGISIDPTEVEREQMNTVNLIADRVIERL